MSKTKAAHYPRNRCVRQCEMNFRADFTQRRYIGKYRARDAPRLEPAEPSAKLKKRNSGQSLETNFQDLAVVADEPSRVRIGKTHRPVSAGVGQPVPGLAFIGSPSGRSGVEVRGGFSGDDDSLGVRRILPSGGITVTAKRHAIHIGEAEDRSTHWRFLRKSPGFAAVARSRRRSGSIDRQISAAKNAV